MASIPRCTETSNIPAAIRPSSTAASTSTNPRRPTNMEGPNLTPNQILAASHKAYMFDLFGESPENSCDSSITRPRTPGADLEIETPPATPPQEKLPIKVTIPLSKLSRLLVAKCQVKKGIPAQVILKPGEAPQLHVPEEAWLLPKLPPSRWDRRHRHRLITVDCGEGPEQCTLWEANLRGYFDGAGPKVQPKQENKL